MKSSGWGSMINIPSITGLGSATQAHAYSATKWSVHGMTKPAAVELAPFGIRVNSVHPGLIETQMMDESNVPLEEFITRVPSAAHGVFDELSKLVIFLASDDSNYCTDHEFVADGALKV